MTRDEAMITAWLAREDTQMVMGKLQAVAEALQKDYDDIRVVSDPKLVLQTHITRDVIQNTIPRIIEGFMNSGKPEPRWSFKAWFKAVVLRERE